MTKLLFLLVGLASLFASNYSVQAQSPDYVTIDSVRVFNSIFSSGDSVLVLRYSLVYSVSPTDPIEDLFTLRLSSGSTIISSRQVNRAGYNMTSLYLSSGVITWGSAYTITLTGNPTTLPSLTPVSRVLAPADYVSSSSTTVGRASVSSHLLSQLSILEPLNGQTYSEGTQAGRFLTTAGVDLIKNAIPSSESVLPIFQARITTPELTQGTPTNGLSTSTANNIGSRTKNAFSTLGGKIGVGGSVASSMFTFILFYLPLVGLMIANGVRPDVSSALGIPFLLVFAFFGLISVAAIAIASILVVVLFAYHFWIQGGG